MASLGYPSDQDFKWLLKSNQIKDCPVTYNNAVIADKVWGPSVASLKGKTTRKTPLPVTSDIIQIPVKIRDLHRYITISIDVLFVNKIPFFATLSRKIIFTMVTHLSNQKIGIIFKAFSGIFKYYYQRGFQIVNIMDDNEFTPLEPLLVDLPGAPRLNLTSANEHEPYIERRIRVVKECTRAVRHSLPFAKMPACMITHMVFFVVKLLNHFPAMNGISDTYSPKAIMSGEQITYHQYSLPFGTYCQVHKEDDPRNSLAARRQGAILLGPHNNRQGGQIFYGLTTARTFVR